jgi:predicted phage baseplate assembly protein
VTLQPVQLDDLTWTEMMAAIRRRIPAESDGNWTVHAPVDPGITLLELYAWLFEQRLYWLDQIPDAVVVGVLDLLGLGGPQPAQPAGTVLRVMDASVRVVRAGTPFARDEREEVVFTTDTTITVLPVTGITLWAGGRDRTADLGAGSSVPLLPADGGPGEARIALTMPPPLHVSPAERLSLLFQLETPGEVRPGWHPEAVTAVPPPAEITWWFEHDGASSRFEPADVQDGTQGLRRSGVILLTIPEPWRTAPGGGARPHTLVLRTERATFSAPPRLLQLGVNVATARHHRRVRTTRRKQPELDRQIRGRPPLPGLHLDLPEAQDRLLTARLRLRERDGGWHNWKATRDLTFHGRGDRVFVVDRAAGALQFGDGRTGRVPHPYRGNGNERLLRVRWEVGGGIEGNGGTNGNWRRVWHNAPAVTAENVVPAEGGRAAETIEQATRRAAAALRERLRAVTATDFETLARETPGLGVGRAHAAIGDHPGHPCAKVPGAASVYVVPHAPRGADDFDRADFVPAPVPDPGARRAICARLLRGRLVAAEVFLRDPRYRRTRVRVELAGAPANPASVRRRIHTQMRRYLDPLIGGDGETGWPFGEPLRPSALLRVAQEAVASDAEVAAVAIWVDGGTAWQDCQDVPIGAHELVLLQDVRVLFAPAAAQSEGLQ